MSVKVKNKLSLSLLSSVLLFFTYFSAYGYSVDFAQPNSTNARKWLTSKNFKFQSDATDQSELALSFKNKALVLDAKTKLFGIIMDKFAKPEKAKKIKIVWGIEKFPDGANYEEHINNEAVMVYVYFGEKKLSSNSIFIPNSPYFIGLFLGEKEPVNNPFIGKHFKQGGRFICAANPKLNETVTSEFDLEKGFKECFGKKKDVPPISGIALEVETSNTTPSKAFIKSIELTN